MYEYRLVHKLLSRKFLTCENGRSPDSLNVIRPSQQKIVSGIRVITSSIEVLINAKKPAIIST